MTPRAPLALLALTLLTSACSSGDDNSSAAVVEVLTASRAVVQALATEESVARVEILGTTEVLDPRPVALPEAREHTDQAIEALEAAVADDADASSAFDEVLDAADDLAAARSQADGTIAGDVPGAHRVADAVQVSEGYEPIVEAVLDSTVLYTSSIDQASLAHGAQLYVEALLLHNTTAEAFSLLSELLLAEGGETRAAITDVSALRARLTTGLTSLDDLAAGTAYEPVVQDATEDLDASDVVGILDRMLDEGLDTVAFADQLTALTAAGEATSRLLIDVEGILVDQAG